jgi:acetylornithine deacetylase/succinyl-diaminopimelate desuccinylase-like protein
MLDTVLLWIDKNRARWLGDLKNWLNIPSISAQPDHAKDVAAAAQWVFDYARTIGMKAEILPTAGHPVVLLTTPDNLAPKDAPHILIYGHYDVQPPEPLELWKSPPFTPTVRDEILYARGAVDDKGQVHCHLAALSAWKEINQSFPCRVTMLIEGEEEVGSPNFMSVVNDRKEFLKTARTLIISDTSIYSRDVPSITYGLRGLVGTEMVITGANSDLHSGTFGGTIANPAHALCEMIARLHDSQGRITVPGFYDDVIGLTDKERKMWATLPYSDAQFAGDLGLTELYGEAGYTTLERKYGRPTLEINGLTSGYQGPGNKTVLPNRASCKITCRLVPGQDAEKIMDQVQDYLRKIKPPGVTLEFSYRSKGSPPCVTPLESPAMEAAGAAMKAAFGKAPVFKREGGSIPVPAWFKETLGIDTVMMGFGLPDDRIHAPNEKFELRQYYAGIKACAVIYQELADRLK